MLNRNETLIWNGGDDRATSGARATRDTSANPGASRSELYDQLFAFTRDIMGLQTADPRSHTAEPYAPGDWSGGRKSRSWGG